MLPDIMGPVESMPDLYQEHIKETPMKIALASMPVINWCNNTLTTPH